MHLRSTFADRTDDLASTATPTLVQFEPELAAARHPVAFDILQMSCGSRHCTAIVRTWRVDTHEVSLCLFPTPLFTLRASGEQTDFFGLTLRFRVRTLR